MVSEIPFGSQFPPILLLLITPIFSLKKERKLNSLWDPQSGAVQQAKKPEFAKGKIENSADNRI